jgi:hypothetical protein
MRSHNYKMGNNTHCLFYCWTFSILYPTGFNEVNFVGQIPSFMLIEIEQTIKSSNFQFANKKYSQKYSLREPINNTVKVCHCNYCPNKDVV